MSLLFLRAISIALTMVLSFGMSSAGYAEVLQYEDEYVTENVGKTAGSCTCTCQTMSGGGACDITVTPSNGESCSDVSQTCACPDADGNPIGGRIYEGSCHDNTVDNYSYY